MFPYFAESLQVSNHIGKQGVKRVRCVMKRCVNMAKQAAKKYTRGGEVQGQFFFSCSLLLLVQQPRSQALSPFPPLSSRRETLVAAGHVSMYTNQSRTRGGSSTKFLNRIIQFCLGEGKL